MWKETVKETVREYDADGNLIKETIREETTTDDDNTPMRKEDLDWVLHSVVPTAIQ